MAPASALGHDVGRVALAPYTRTPQQVYLFRSLTPQQAERVYAHELGHVIEELAGGIPTARLNTELRQVYNALNTGMERTRHLTGPQHLGYRGADVPRELMAEAIRAYLADPNYLKTVAPKTAAAIRVAVNSHPTLRKISQFNAIASPVAMGAIDPEPAEWRVASDVIAAPGAARALARLAGRGLKNRPHNIIGVRGICPSPPNPLPAPLFASRGEGAHRALGET